MTSQEAKIRIEKLRKEINHHRYMYHVMDRLDISETVLDSLKHELFKLEQQFPKLVTSDSPTQRVGGQPLDKFKKVTHGARMTSLEDVFSEDEFREWVERIQKIFPIRKFDFFSELKVDGFAVSLQYEDGIFSIGATRGDGLVGEDVTQNLKTIESVPLHLEINDEIGKRLTVQKIIDEKILKNIKDKIKFGKIEIRGEVYMTKKAFEDVNKEQEKKGLALYANPRNTAAGSIRQLDPKIAASRKLDFLAYDIVTDFGQETHGQEHAICKMIGFKTDGIARSCKDAYEVIDLWKEVARKRERLSHLIDGVVVVVNDNKLFENLGIVGKAPRGAAAFKFAPMEVTTIVEDISVHVGRTGALTPVAHLRPAQVGGVTISRASLHNIDEIKRLGLRIGDTVIVQRAGDVIPDVTQVLTGLRTGKEKEFYMPKKCPVCGGLVVRPKGEVAHRCANKKCQARKKENLYHFASKKAFNILGLGPRILDVLFDQGLIQDSADLYELKEGDLLPLERFAEKSATNLLSSIAGSKNIFLKKFIYGLGIIHVGEENSSLLAKNFFRQLTDNSHKITARNILNFFQNISLDGLQEIPGIGTKVAQSIYNWFHDKTNIEFMEKLDKIGIVIIASNLQASSSKLQGLSFVLTGEMESMSRDEAKDRIRALGGDISESVSKKTSYVVVGKNPGSKYNKAIKLEVKKVNEKEFLKMIKEF